MRNKFNAFAKKSIIFVALSIQLKLPFMYKNYLWLLVIVLLANCEKDPSKNWKPKDLITYGIPITILSPDSVIVRAQDYSWMKDVTLKNDEDKYFVQIYASNATTTDLARVKSDQLNTVKDMRYFSKVVREDEEGFIYESAIDSTNTSYGFRYVQIKGDKEYVFQTGLVGTFSLEDVENMYKAVKYQPK
jgi:hypothetical protein